MKRFLVIILCFVPTFAMAHDFFLVATPSQMKKGDSVTIAIHVDDVFPGKHTKWNTQRILRFEHWLDNNKTDFKTLVPKKDSSGVNLPLNTIGTHLFALDWSARLIELKPEDFTEYLTAEGLDHILKLRKERGEETKPGRERYSRFVKTLVQVGNETSDSYKSIVGQTIELVPLDNPYDKKVNDSIRVQLFFRNTPLANALVSATYEGFTTKPDTYQQSLRTDSNGIAVFRLTHSGRWLIRTVHMLPLQDSKEADWESWWASVTFEIR